MYSGRSYAPRPIGFGGSGAPLPPDLLVLLGVLFVTFSLQFFATTELIPALLRLTPLVWRAGFLWQLGTYAFVGYGGPGLFFLLELLMIFWFGRDVHRYLGRRQFWMLVGWGVGVGSLAAVATELLSELLAGPPTVAPFAIMQGQHALFVILIAAFATLYGNATIYLFFVLPLRARWFLWLELLFAFMAFLATHDFAGFVGLCAAVGMTYSLLTGRGLRRTLREWRLRLEQRAIEAKLRRMKAKRGFRVVRGDDDDDGGGGGPWVH